MFNTRQVNPLFAFVLFVLGVAFCLPLHLYPLPNFIEELLVALAVTVAVGVLLWRLAVIRLSVWMLGWLLLGVLFLWSAVWHEAAFVSAKLFYLLFWFCGAMALLLGDQLDWGKEEPALILAWVLFASTLICAVGGFLRHYGLLWSGFDAIVPQVSTGRMIGLVGHSNFFAFICLSGLLAAAWLFHARRIPWFVLVGAAVLYFYCIVGSGGRAVLVAWVLLGGFLLLRAGSWRLDRFSAVVILALLAFLFLKPFMGVLDLWLQVLFPQKLPFDPNVFSLFGRGVDSSGRLDEWAITLQLVGDNPWSGVGVGNYAGASYAKHVELGLQSVGGLFLHSHNLVLQVLVELGLPGGIWLLFMGGAALWFFWCSRRKPNRLLPLSILLVFGVYSMFEFPLWLMHFFVLNLLLLGALGGPAIEVSLRFRRLLSVVVLLACSGFALVYVPYVERFYWSFKQYFARAAVDPAQYRFMDAMTRDPLLEPYGYLIYFANFQVAPSTLDMEQKVLERFRSFLPYVQLLPRLAVIYLAQGDERAGLEAVRDMRTFYGDAGEAVLKEQIAEARKAFPDTSFSVLLP